MKIQILTALLAFPAFGATLTVTTPTDNGPGSLRNAISVASDGDTIVFGANIHSIVLTSGELNITKDISIAGPGRGRLSIERHNNAIHFRILEVSAAGPVSISGVTISGGYADASFGAGIYNEQAELTLTDCAITDNVSVAGAGGGGIYNSGDLLILNSVVASNEATSPGFFFHVGSGGGISNGGDLTIVGSSINNNSAVLNGGGIIHSAGVLTVLNSTIHHNQAGSELPLSGNGGGLLAVSGTVEIMNSTVSGNAATTAGTGIFNEAALALANSTLADDIFNAAELEIQNTILAAVPSLENSGEVTSLGYNLARDDASGFLIAHGDQTNVDPLLGALMDNGGPTLTHKLGSKSPAIDAGNPDFIIPPTSTAVAAEDQRGMARVYESRVDIGSFEAQPRRRALQRR